MFTITFWKATAERVVRGAAVAVAALLGLAPTTQAVGSVNVQTLAVAALYGALGSLVLCLAGTTLGAGDGPSLTGKEELT